ncbi:hypothetical protein BKA67DRAFT_536421 [Truncatella angustata]|uniref:Uncharacterized protein n=1 Tax=Truncatella angustata TaxID=152316 RepID=A0A9P8ZVK2_9PEZI|nr:uncharacterized protein BKA67DRAFT_536421 [Truncatella angustata]KAH6652695.1 hypothetical protein BKA67DRAFT_536421 [Truncatella angustata]
MADNENFEDDLFADLYDDNEAAAAAAPAAPVAPAPAAAPVTRQAAPAEAVAPAAEHDAAQYDQYMPTGDDNGHSGDYHDNEDAYDDDDDVDFNLGNGSSSAHNAGLRHEEEVAMPSFHSKGPSNKGEDGYQKASRKASIIPCVKHRPLRDREKSDFFAGCNKDWQRIALEAMT